MKANINIHLINRIRINNREFSNIIIHFYNNFKLITNHNYNNLMLINKCNPIRIVQEVL